MTGFYSFSLTEVESLGADVSSCSEAKTVQEKTKTTETPPTVSQTSGLTPTEKRLRALKKKLQQIDSLKEKRENGEVLEKTQVSLILSVKARFCVRGWIISEAVYYRVCSDS